MVLKVRVVGGGVPCHSSHRGSFCSYYPKYSKFILITMFYSLFFFAIFVNKMVRGIVNNFKCSYFFSFLHLRVRSFSFFCLPLPAPLWRCFKRMFKSLCLCAIISNIVGNIKPSQYLPLDSWDHFFLSTLDRFQDPPLHPHLILSSHGILNIRYYRD